MTDERSRFHLAGGDRGEVERLRRDYWRDAFERAGPEPALRASAALREHMQRVRPEWPSAQERAADLRHHVEFSRLLARVANARTD